MLNKLLYRLTGNLPCRHINLENGPYLERYYVGQLFGVTFYLHRFVSSDSERHIHNHPWNRGGSIILAGSYTEERCVDVCHFVSGSGCVTEMTQHRWFNVVNSNTFHRIHDAKPGTWTLFFHGARAMVQGRAKGWGFFERRWVEGLHDTTVFVPHEPSLSQWWLTAPKGNAGRVKL